MPSEDELIEQRLAKRERLLASADVYPARVVRTHTAAAAAEAFLAAGEVDEQVEVTVVGRVTAQRVMGKAAFLDLRDQSGR
ncbi:MAG: lysine--tRNA ligase, partial [Dehalococcoidia bacterium]